MLTLTVDEPNDNSVFDHKCFVNFGTQHPAAQQVGAAQQKTQKTLTHTHAPTRTHIQTQSQRCKPSGLDSAKSANAICDVLNKPLQRSSQLAGIHN